VDKTYEGTAVILFQCYFESVVIRIMEGYGNRVSCRDSFKKTTYFALEMSIFIVPTYFCSSK
jgi:hypothetical protein